MINPNSSKTLEAIWPILGVFNGVAISHRGILTIGWELELPAAYTMEQKEYDAIEQNMYSALQTLPPFFVVHKQDVQLKKHYEPQYNGHPMHDDFQRSKEGKAYFEHHCYLYISRASMLTFLPKTGTCGLVNKSSAKLKTKPEDIVRFRNECDKFIASLCSGPISARELTEEDWYGNDEKAGLIAKAMFLGNDSPLISDLTLDDDLVKSCGKKAQSFIIADARALPNEVSNTISIESMSSHLNSVYLSFGSKLSILLPFEHAFNQVIMIPEQNAAMNKLNKKNNLNHSGADSVDNAINAEEIDTFGQNAYKESLLMVYANFNVLVWGKENEQENIRSAITSAIQSMGIKAIYNQYNTPAIWYSSIPGVAAELSEDDAMLMEANGPLCMFSWDSYEKPMEGGLLTVADRMRLTPITIDIQDLAIKKGYLNAFNIFLLGPTGSGKSVTTNLIAQNHYEAGEHIFILDVGDSYEGYCEYVHESTGGRDGQYYAWEPERPYSFNPFQKMKDWSNADNNGYQCLISILTTMWSPKGGGWTNGNLPILYRIVDDFIKEHENDETDPIFDDFYNYVGTVVRPKILPKYVGKKLVDKKPEEMLVVSFDPVTPDKFDVSEFCTALSSYALNGKYGQVLNNREPADILASRYVVFEISKIPNDKKDGRNDPLYTIVILCILNYFDDKMRRTPETKMMIIEEAWKALGEETTSGYIKALWKTARKYNCQAMVVTQQLSDIHSSSTISDTIVANSGVQILMEQNATEQNIRGIIDFMGLSEKNKNLLLTINKNIKGYYKEAFIKWGDNKKMGVYAILASQRQLLLFESNKTKKKPLYDKAKELGSIDAALDYFCARAKELGSMDAALKEYRYVHQA